jgi:hypothetical protein
MSFTRSVDLPCAVPDAFLALHDPLVFRAVSRPFLCFSPVSPQSFPPHFTSGESYVVAARAFGVFPLGTQEINPQTSITPERSVFTDNGRGLSGSLGVMKHFHHTMTLERRGRAEATLIDTLEWDAGVLSPAFFVGFRFFWWWRHTMMKRLAKRW